MSNPPAHRRLVPRRPSQGKEPEDLEVTRKRIVFDPSVLDLEDDAAPLDSLSEMTLERPRYDPPEELDPTSLRRAAPEPEPAPEAEAEAAPALEPAPELERAPSAGDTFAELTVLRASSTLIETTAPGGRPAPERGRPMSEPLAGVSLVDLEPTTLHAPPTKSGIEDRPTSHTSPAEYGLLAAIAEDHEPSRLRYADWLERRGEPARAELLRTDHALRAMSADDPRFIPMLQRLRALAPRVSVDWRSRVSRAAIEGCAAYGVTCPTYWRALPAEADDVRTCQTCGDKVYYCVTIQLAQDRVQKGQCVALDLTCERWPHDLDRQCDGCSGQVSPQSRFCPHCGRPMPRAQSVG